MLTSPKTSPILLSMDTPATYTASSPSLSSPTHAPTQPPSDGMRGVPSVPLKPLDRSSWIAEVLYRACPDGRTYMAIFKHTSPGEEPEALLYGPDIPSYLPGLVQAGVIKDGRHSVGRAYNKHVKGKYPYQSVKGAEKVKKLRAMMLVG